MTRMHLRDRSRKLGSEILILAYSKLEFIVLFVKEVV